jgi:hypothetical protein
MVHFERERKKKMLIELNIEGAAKICHTANMAYCQIIGDNSQVSWEDSPEWQKQSARNGVEFHLANLKMGKKLNPADSHSNWLSEKRAAGWKYGPVKDIAKKEHPCFMPYSALPTEQRVKDYIFCAIVEGLYNSLAA